MSGLHDNLDFAAALRALTLLGVIALSVGVGNRAGRETGEQAVVATVEAKIPEEQLRVEERLGTVFGADKVDVVEASALQMLFAQPQRFGLDEVALRDLEDRCGFPFPPGALIPQPLTTFAARMERRKRKTSYTPPPGVSLGPLKGKMKLRCHAGPDAGWTELRRFINAVDRELIVGMYDFSAPHIGDALLSVMTPAGRAFRLVLDKGDHLDKGVKRNDRTEAVHATLFERGMGDRFDYAFAFTDKDGATFFSDYHIKLAVRDRRAFWMSSGVGNRPISRASIRWALTKATRPSTTTIANGMWLASMRSLRASGRISWSGISRSPSGRGRNSSLSPSLRRSRFLLRQPNPPFTTKRSTRPRTSSRMQTGHTLAHAGQLYCRGQQVG